MPNSSSEHSFTHTAFLSPRAELERPVCRLGLATRGNTGLTPDDVGHAVESGVNFLNWCGSPDGLSGFIAGLGQRRPEIAVCVQFEARTATDGRDEFEHILRQLHTDYLDVLTFYYVEERAEWEQIIGPGGALEFCTVAQREGRVRMIGVTSHQRRLAAEMADSGLLDMLMIRYNAAHRGAETEVFPVTTARGLPVVVYTCLRWGALLRPTPDDPPGFIVPPAPAWYRFAVQHPAVAVALMAPENRAELEEDLRGLREMRPLSAEEYERLAGHGQRVRRHAGSFP
ncbi:MAG TPA: aldo/keto reductase [Gemmataceae bacterium]|jgi:predicted aldo/keto reductase-like oxidoreductase